MSSTHQRVVALKKKKNGIKRYCNWCNSIQWLIIKVEKNNSQSQPLIKESYEKKLREVKSEKWKKFISGNEGIASSTALNFNPKNSWH